jgi:hypothetical protein
MATEEEEEEYDPVKLKERDEAEYNAQKHTLPPPESRQWKDYALYPYLAARSYFARVTGVLGLQFLLFLGVSQMLLKGLGYYLTTSMMMPMFKSVFGLDASHLQIMSIIVIMPWSIKPILGLLSDLTLIGGYHKRYWLVQAFVVGCICSGFSILAYHNKSGIGVALCFMGVQFQIAMFDLLSESTYSIIMRDRKYTGGDLVTLTQGYQHIGALLATLFLGVFADHQLFYPLLSAVGVVCLLPIAPVLLGWLPEIKNPHGTPLYNRFFQLVGRAQLHRDKGMIILIAFSGIAAPITTTAIEAGDPAMGLATSVVMTILVLMGAYMVFPRIIFQIALLQVVINLSRPKLGGAMDFFYTADAMCVPGGPHFSYSFYMSVSGVIGILTSLAGIIIYQSLLSGFRFRPVLIMTAVLSGITGASDLFIVTRANVALGIPDHAAFLIGEAIFEPVLNMLNYIPVTILLSKAVPVGMESSAFAFLAGVSNFAAMTSELTGALVFDVAGIKTTSPCNFDALWWLILLCHVSLPIAGGVGASFLVPNKYQTESLLEEETDELTEGQFVMVPTLDAAMEMSEDESISRLES